MSAAERAPVTMFLNGERRSVSAGVSVAAAILASGATPFRTSVTGEPRAALCGMGVCYECRVTIDGMAHRRACLVTVAEGMHVETDSAVPS